MKIGQNGPLAEKKGLWMSFAVVAVLVLVVPSVSSMIDAPEQDETDIQALVADRAGPACSDAPQKVLDSSAYQEARELLAQEVGFVDLQVGHGEDGLIINAVFDAHERTGPLPGAPAEIDGIPVRFIADAFVPLSLIEQDLGTDMALQPIPILPCPQEIRPGARMTQPAGCTFNFVFRDNLDRLYIGTAGHCTNSVGERVATPSVGHFGTVIYRIENGVGADFALIRVDADKYDRVNPEMCHWGGPNGISTASVYLHHYGHGVGFGLTEQTRARTGTLGLTGSDSFAFTGTAIFGDSGSGAVSNLGRGIGTITHIGTGTGNVFGTRADHGLNLAEAATGLEFTIETADFNGLL